MADMQLLDRFDNYGVVHFVHFDALANRLEQRDGKFAAEVFAEFFQAAQKDQRVGGVDVE